MADVELFREGQRWAWRQDRRATTFYEALILTVDKRRPAKIRIELVDNHWRGDRRWVSPARLEVPWNDRHAYIELDRKQRALQLWSPSRDDRRAAEHILVELVPLEIVWYNADAHGVSSVYDVPAVSHILGIPESDIRAAPAYEHEGELFVPWPMTERMARTAAQQSPDRLLTEIEREERVLNEESLWGTTVTDFDGVDHELSATDVRARFEKYQRPRLDKLREYIGVERADDLLERRDLLRRLGLAAGVAQRALDKLEPSQKGFVAKLRRELNDATDGVNALPPS